MDKWLFLYDFKKYEKLDSQLLDWTMKNDQRSICHDDEIVSYYVHEQKKFIRAGEPEEQIPTPFESHKYLF